MKEEAVHEPVLQKASIGVLYGDVDTPVEETGMEVVGQLMKQVILLNTHLTASCNLQNAHSDQAKIYCKNQSMVPLTVLFYCSPLPTPAPTLTSSQPRYCIVWPKYKCLRVAACGRSRNVCISESTAKALRRTS
jgi:hypothetical protein